MVLLRLKKIEWHKVNSYNHMPKGMDLLIIQPPLK